MNRREFLGAAGSAFAAAMTAARIGTHPPEIVSRGSGLPQRLLGNTGKNVSLVAFGGIALAPLSGTEAISAVRSLIDRGVNHFDVAPSYADSEVKMGPALRGGYRDRVFLACKTLERSEEGARRELEQSLKRLGAGHLDLYQFHSVDTLEELDRILAPGGAMDAFQAAREKGLIRFIGVTGHHPGVQLEALRRYPFATIMVPVDFVDHFYMNPEGGLLPYAQAKGVGIIAIKATYRSAVKDLKAAYSYTLSQPISSTIPAGNMREIKAVVELLPRLKPMSVADMAALFRDSPYLGNAVCRQCGFCLPCPAGIDIRYLFALEGYAKRYSQQHAAATYRALRVRGSACIGCGECTRRCPFGLDAMNRIKSMDSTFSA
jgi:predicted aldo/keto reductase-like oxidoreductase